jgi:hypothetical protein
MAVGINALRKKKSDRIAELRAKKKVERGGAGGLEVIVEENDVTKRARVGTGVSERDLLGGSGSPVEPATPITVDLSEQVDKFNPFEIKPAVKKISAKKLANDLDWIEK